MSRVVDWLRSDVSPVLGALVALSGALSVFTCLLWWRGCVGLLADVAKALTGQSLGPRIGMVVFYLGILTVLIAELSIGSHAAWAWSRHRGISVLLVLVWLVVTLLFLPVAFYLRLTHGIASDGLKLPY